MPVVGCFCVLTFFIFRANKIKYPSLVLVEDLGMLKQTILKVKLVTRIIFIYNTFSTVHLKFIYNFVSISNSK